MLVFLCPSASGGDNDFPVGLLFFSPPLKTRQKNSGALIGRTMSTLLIHKYSRHSLKLYLLFITNIYHLMWMHLMNDRILLMRDKRGVLYARISATFHSIPVSTETRKQSKPAGGFSFVHFLKYIYRYITPPPISFLQFSMRHLSVSYRMQYIKGLLQSFSSPVRMLLSSPPPLLQRDANTLETVLLFGARAAASLFKVIVLTGLFE